MPKTAEQREAEKRFFLLHPGFEDDLVDVVKCYEAIWNPRHPAYRTANRDDLFEKIAHDLHEYEYNISPGFARAHWEELVEKYNRKRQDIPATGGEDEKESIIRKWPLFQRMDFLYNVTGPGALQQTQATVEKAVLKESQDEIPMPAGWEKRVDAMSGKAYYIDHARKVTQWDDPRLRHPSIWRESQNRVLANLKAIFPDAPEETVRQTLLKTRFQEHDASSHLSSLGYKKTASVVVGQSAANVMSAPSTATTQRAPSTPGQRAQDFQTTDPNAVQRAKTTLKSGPSATSPSQQRGAASAGADPYTLMALKAKFPETTDDVLADVLNQCGQNVDKASRELMNMGYSGRQKAVDRVAQMEIRKEDSEREHKLKVKDDRDRHLRQLKNEFEGFLDADVADVLEKSKSDLYEARNTLRKREAEMRMQALAADTAPPAPSAVQIITVKETPTDTIVTETVVASRERSSSAEPGPIMATESKSVVITKDEKARQESRKKEARKRELAEGHKMVSKSTGTTPTHHISERKTLARGPNPELRQGSDPNLRSGPNPSIRHGTSRELKTHQVIVAM